MATPVVERSVTNSVEATLTDDGDGTVLVIEVSGLPLDNIAAYGVGWQLHTENLHSYLTGQPRPDLATRWNELSGPYQERAAQLAGTPEPSAP